MSDAKPIDEYSGTAKISYDTTPEAMVETVARAIATENGVLPVHMNEDWKDYAGMARAAIRPLAPVIAEAFRNGHDQLVFVSLQQSLGKPPGPIEMPDAYANRIISTLMGDDNERG